MGFSRLRSFGLVALTSLSATGCALHAEPSFDRVSARADMLALVSNPPIPTLEIEYLDQVRGPIKALLEYYRTVIHPLEEQLGRLGITESVLQVAIDRALYDNADEGAAWKKRMEDAGKQRAEITTSDEYKNKYRRLGKLAGSLKGELPDYARRSAEDIERTSFAASELPKVNKLIELEAAITEVANTSPVASQLGASTKRTNEIVESYHRGQMTFDAAWREIESLMPQNFEGMGQDVANRGGSLMHDAAVIRTELAKSKGFANWAEYQMAVQERSYAKGQKTVADRRAWLEELMTLTEPVYRSLLTKLLPASGEVSVENLRYSQVTLLKLPTEPLVQHYFPVEGVSDLWKKTVIESGFDPKDLTHIRLDNFPRDGKQTHAYMSNVTSREPKVFRISARSLSLDLRPGDAKFPADIFVVENFRDDGMDPVETMLHEGGHSLDYTFRDDFWGLDAAYGYTEIHSTLQERFAQDVEWLMANGKTREGVPLDRARAEAFVLNFKVNDVVMWRRQVSQAIMDLDLWNYDYTQAGAEKMVDRLTRLRGETLQQALFTKPIVVSGIDSRFGSLATNHFYGGEVRYAGYIHAFAATAFSALALTDKLVKTTGRGSWYQQPSIAGILKEGYYRRGFAVPFPKSVEKFTGVPFEPAPIVNILKKAVDGYDPIKNDCKGLLSDAGTLVAARDLRSPAD